VHRRIGWHTALPDSGAESRDEALGNFVDMSRLRTA
jgi:hypothetical protein